MYQIKLNGEFVESIPIPDYASENVNKTVSFVRINDIPPPSAERLDELRKQVLYLKTLPQPAQRSAEWYNMRENMITASVWGSVLKQNKYSHRNAVVMQKCGHPGYQFKGNVHTEWGKKYETAAVKVYESRNNTVIWEFGVIAHPHFPFLGASPDGITPDGVMVEIKCPPKRIINGEISDQYWCQMQGQMEVCKLDRCDFLECKIDEYEIIGDDTMDCPEYFADNYHGDTALSSLGMEKGVVLNFMNKKTTDLSYVHSNLGINREQYLKWKDEVIAQKKDKEPDLIYVESSFWKLSKVSCIPVFRDVKWFYSVLPILRRCWEDIEYFRKVGYDKLLKKKVEPDNDITTYLDIVEEPIGALTVNNINEYEDMKKFLGVPLFSTSTSNKMPPQDNSPPPAAPKKGLSLFSSAGPPAPKTPIPTPTPTKPVKVIDTEPDPVKMQMASKQIAQVESEMKKNLKKLNKMQITDKDLESVINDVKDVQCKLNKITNLLQKYTG